MPKILLILFVLVVILVAGCVAGYFGVRYYLTAYYSPEYFFVHPRLAGAFNISPVCPAICVAGGVCGKDEKNYCNTCIAFEHGAGYAHPGACVSTIWKNYRNSEFGFQITFPDSWKGYTALKQQWQGYATGDSKKKYSGVLILIKNPQTTSSQKWQDIPIMVFTPELWGMVSGPNAVIAVSAAPIGPEKIGENAKYIFATPPRWYGFTDDMGWQEAVNIVKTFRAF